MTVLILAREFDPTVDAVVSELTERQVPTFRADLGDFPQCLGMAAELRDGRWEGHLWTDHRAVALESVRSVWYRNPSAFSFPDAMPLAERTYARREAVLGLGGVLAALDVLWANHPNRCADAVYKPYQWAVAVSCGLAVADTQVTNSPEAALRFVGRARRGVITKSLGGAGIVAEDRVLIGYTRRLTRADLTDLSGVAVTATTVQHWVPKAFEVRLTVIGDEWFPISIHAASEEAHVDWRADPAALSYGFVPIPDEVVAGVRLFMRRMKLVYAGFDFVVRPDGGWVMLEANTGPQFGWLESATGARMSAAMAETLAGGAA
ncbi:ATP-grasp ribosomal peptide maturase [Allokutzneria sp. A3M-2-11 16]|uniref:ATP-grasp ribosomal peptide maturase n=1 Tax=Allokutzneria sp. A3M-2-11 16 TaxID=2962043 RepID=UPI0020B731AD|nr:ATP-grasp ribosomal peptide maturase [Allokutzneria sp. A3M-2-11 16]MCP3802284.1 ATP-grasp ribosomal peptide maturase [Allokutzneria sp. A3M-2-11 16]